MTYQAASTTFVSDVPFHCVICYEEFRSKGIFPVILPCGHTYVCNLCAAGMERCMECQESLFLKVTRPSSIPTINSTTSVAANQQGGLSSLFPNRSLVPLKNNHNLLQDPIRLPLPKNITLMAMIEAADKQRANASSILEGSKDMSNIRPTVVGKLCLDRTFPNIETTSSTCGTYSVRESKGLTVIACHPEKIDTNSDCDSTSSKRESSTVVQEQTVQIVKFFDNVAKLARGAGYIVARSSQLVKVCGPMERSCKLEGLLETVVCTRGRTLQLAINENRKIENSLREEVNLERTKYPNYPMINHDRLKETEKYISTKQTHFGRGGDWAAREMQQTNIRLVSVKQEKLHNGLDCTSEEICSPPEAINTSVEVDPLNKGSEINSENTLYAKPLRSKLPSPNTASSSKIASQRNFAPSSVEGSAVSRRNNYNKEDVSTIPYELYPFDFEGTAIPRNRKSCDDLKECLLSCGIEMFGNDMLNFDEGNDRQKVGLLIDNSGGYSAESRETCMDENKINQPLIVVNACHGRGNQSIDNSEITRPLTRKNDRLKYQKKIFLGNDEVFREKIFSQRQTMINKAHVKEDKGRLFGGTLISHRKEFLNDPAITPMLSTRLRRSIFEPG